MKLKELVSELTHEVLQGNLETEVTTLVMDNRKIEKGSVFVCIAGANFDGHSVAKEAVEKGAAALVV